MKYYQPRYHSPNWVGSHIYRGDAVDMARAGLGTMHNNDRRRKTSMAITDYRLIPVTPHGIHTFTRGKFAGFIMAQNYYTYITGTPEAVIKGLVYDRTPGKRDDPELLAELLDTARLFDIFGRRYYLHQSFRRKVIIAYCPPLVPQHIAEMRQLDMTRGYIT